MPGQFWKPPDTRPDHRAAARWISGSSRAAPGKAGSGTSSSPAATTSDTRAWSARGRATRSMTGPAGRWF